jgi:hypothetical protein
MNDSELLSTADVASVLSLSSDMVRVLAREGRLRPAAQSVRGVRLFRRSDVEALRSERAGLASHTHAVQFYENAEFLVRVVASFVGEGLRAGAPGLVITTCSHRDAIRERLRSDGFDLRSAAWSSKVEFLDAKETLAQLMVDGVPNRARFRTVVSAALERAIAAAPRARPRIYGEMVDILWKDDQPKAAVELERLWNDLGRKGA